jgi:mannose-1-phosphate guanylyltransferase/phosphomannomutase
MSNDQGLLLHALILAGGKGTRSENPLTPKILQEISGNQSLLDLHLRLLEDSNPTSVTLLLGHLHDVIAKKLQKEKSNYSFLIDWKIDSPGDNPVKVVYNAISTEKNEDSIFVLILGDVLVNSNYADYARDLQNSNFCASVLVHPNLHPNESDVFEFDLGNKAVLLRTKGETVSNKQPTRAIAGVYFLKKSSIKFFSLNEPDLTKGIIKPLFDAGELNVVNSADYFQDTGTKERLGKARRDFESSAFWRRGKISKQAIFVELECIYSRNIGIHGGQSDSEIIMPEMHPSILKANSLGIPVLIISEDSGLISDSTGNAEFLETLSWVESSLRRKAAIFDDFAFFPPNEITLAITDDEQETDPKNTSRKSISCTIEEISSLLSIDVNKSILIGQSLESEMTAERLGILFTKYDGENNAGKRVNDLINQAVDRILA